HYNSLSGGGMKSCIKERAALQLLTPRGPGPESLDPGPGNTETQAPHGRRNARHSMLSAGRLPTRTPSSKRTEQAEPRPPSGPAANAQTTSVPPGSTTVNPQ